MIVFTISFAPCPCQYDKDYNTGSPDMETTKTCHQAPASPLVG